MPALTPTELLDDHTRRPRNVGKLLNAGAVGDIGSIVVGDALRFYLGIADGRIAQAKFQVFNCADQIAAASLVTEVAAGRTLDEAQRLGPGDLCAHAGGLDPARLPPRIWALDGLKAALAAWNSTEVEHDTELDPLLCRCFGISEETARQAVRIGGSQTVQDLVDATGAGTGCGSCKADMPALIAEARDEPRPAPAAAPRTGPAGRIQTLMRIQRVAEAKVLPGVRARGGELELWDFDGRLVKVRALGALAADADARRAALADLEQALKAEIDPSLGVDAG
jgi:NifU-like protein